MRKSFLICFVLALITSTFVFPLGAANAQSDTIIQCGLWSGANFDIAGGLNCDTRGNTETSTASSGSVSNTYAALGDSVAAGIGLPLRTTATALDRQCGRSYQSYPNLVAQELGASLTHAACSGATAGDLFTKQSVDGPNIVAQLDTAYARGTPRYMSITAGANDIHWADFIRACYSLNCTRQGYDYAMQTYMTLLSGKLHWALTNISSRANSQPQVVVTGYYNPLSTQCATAGSRITREEITWLTSKLSQLNRTIQDVTSHYDFATFVIPSFSGHDICSSQPWVQGPNSSAPFHPTAEGQAAIAKTVIAAFDN